jgi:hypothetical protein
MAKDVLRKAGREDLPGRFRAAKNILAAGFKREIQALGSTQLFIKGDAAAESDLTGIMERWRSEEKFLMAEIVALHAAVELGAASGSRPSRMSRNGQDRPTRTPP